MKRRTILLSALGASGALLVGWGVAPPRSRLGSADSMLPTQGSVGLNGWIKIGQDGSVALAMPRSEMGQGVHTALAMLAAEELDIALDKVRLEQAGPDAMYGNVAAVLAFLPFHPQQTEEGQRSATVKTAQWLTAKVGRELGLIMTGGSSSVADAWEPVRLAAASARSSLAQAAAAQWQVPVGELVFTQGKISHASGKEGHFGEFAAAAAKLNPGPVSPKARKDWKLIGSPAPRTDLWAKSSGSATFGLDVRLPNMVFAAVRLCPMIGGSVQSVDSAAALAMPGVLKVIPLKPSHGASSGLAVVGKTTWHASQGAQALQVQWAQRPQGALDTKQAAEQLQAQLAKEDGYTFHERGTPAPSQDTLSATYSAPYLGHMTMEPMNCTAWLQDGKLSLWAPAQVPEAAREAAAKAAGLPLAKVEIHITLLGGGFGRRLEVDYVVLAAQVAMALPGQPVQLTWSREEDSTHDFFRPMHVAQLQASHDGLGQVQSLQIKSAGDSISPRWMERALPAFAGPLDAPDKTDSEGLFDLPYGFAHQKMAHVATKVGIPVGFWRSVGHSHNAFFSESFIDELAAKAGTNPLAFRQQWLQDAPRHLAVLNLAAEKSQWGKTLPEGQAQGIALHESFGSIVAQVARVSLEGGTLRVHEVFCAIDCGTVVNPAIVAQQMEGSVVFALSAALWGEVDIVQGEVQQRNFHQHYVVGMAHAPHVHTYIVPSERTPAGVGEPGVPPLAPAVANAVFALNGKRLRSLPLKLT
jgi:isoquinoline 1-oxidoreductase beta subunit